MLYGEDPYSGPGKHSNRKLKHMPFMAHYKSASCHRIWQFRLQLMPLLVHYTASCTCRERLPFIRLPCVTYTVPCLCCSFPHKSRQHSHYTIYIVATATNPVVQVKPSQQGKGHGSTQANSFKKLNCLERDPHLRLWISGPGLLCTCACMYYAHVHVHVHVYADVGA